MKTCLSRITALACLFLCLVGSKAHGFGPPAETELGSLAASMKPGTWAELKTIGYTAALLKAQNHHILE